MILFQHIFWFQLSSCYYKTQRFDTQTRLLSHSASHWPLHLVYKPFQTKEYLTADSTVKTAIHLCPEGFVGALVWSSDWFSLLGYERLSQKE